MEPAPTPDVTQLGGYEDPHDEKRVMLPPLNWAEQQKLDQINSLNLDINKWFKMQTYYLEYQEFYWELLQKKT